MCVRARVHVYMEAEGRVEEPVHGGPARAASGQETRASERRRRERWREREREREERCAAGTTLPRTLLRVHAARTRTHTSASASRKITLQCKVSLWQLLHSVKVIACMCVRSCVHCPLNTHLCCGYLSVQLLTKSCMSCLHGPRVYVLCS